MVDDNLREVEKVKEAEFCSHTSLSLSLSLSLSHCVCLYFSLSLCLLSHSSSLEFVFLDPPGPGYVGEIPVSVVFVSRVDSAAAAGEIRLADQILDVGQNFLLFNKNRGGNVMMMSEEKGK